MTQNWDELKSVCGKIYIFAKLLIGQCRYLGWNAGRAWKLKSIKTFVVSMGWRRNAAFGGRVAILLASVHH